MIAWNQRRALPAQPHVVGAKVKNHVDAKPFGQPLAIAQLHRQPVERPVQHRLAVKADHIDIRRTQPLARQKRLDSGGMPVSQFALQFGEIARTFVALLDRLGNVQGLLQPLAKPRVVGRECRGASPHNAIAVGFQHGQIDAIHRGAAHQPDCPHRRVVCRH